ncbi:hypothetical protein [Dactylosporangium sp. NPDC050588]|uniref:hypothetical protein n=1 Tax=Dactylosporangium sp. NPDC050588 TaxID=3157211 RepID=UPI0033FB0834
MQRSRRSHARLRRLRARPPLRSGTTDEVRAVAAWTAGAAAEQKGIVGFYH